MFVKLARAGGHTYAQIVESYRDANGQPRQRNLLTLGRVDENNGQVDKMLQTLLKARGHGPVDTATPQVQFESALALGDVWALDQLWREIGFDCLAGVFRSARFSKAVEQAIRVMVFNRLCDADSKLGTLCWLQTVSIPGVDTSKLTDQHLLRCMDALMDHQQAVDDCVAHLLRPLIDDELSVVFYDLTTIRSEGHGVQDGDVRHFDMSKEGVEARQFMLGVVQTSDGIPIYHKVFDDNTSESLSLLPTLLKVLARYPHIRRLVMVADRGLLSVDNLADLSAISLPDGQPLEFILAVPGRRYGEFAELLQPLHDAAAPQGQTVAETSWEGLRLIMAYDPQRAQEQTAKRTARIAALEARASHLANKLDRQDAGQKKRGRKLSESGARARLFHEVADSHLSKFIKVDLKSDLFTYDIDAMALSRAQMMDGKLLLVTNVADLEAAQIVQRYKSLADIERGFRVLKSEIEIAPVYHRLPERIRAHASICFMALILYGVMRQRLKAAGHSASPESALAQLRKIQRQSVAINQGVPLTGISNIQREQADLLAAMNIRKPVPDAQLSLL
jgi:transposase